MERVKVETSNFAGGYTVTDIKQKIQNWAKTGHGLGHVTYF